MASKKRKKSEQPSSEEDLERLLQRLINKITPPTVAPPTVPPPNVPVLFTTKDNRDWTSPPFYTHPRGYKMELVISYRRAGNANATPDNPFRCYAKFILLEGEYDDYLRFPIRMSIELHVMKKTTNESRCITFCFDDSAPRECTERWTDNRRRQNTAGDVRLLEYNEIDLYSIDGRFTFMISKVHTNSIHVQ